ncbi:hypothetical protein Scep_018390 [Stephania cephalantha]|uniref:Uncharacterized protein n=1 Tax=Stephania cephalantha TaxID=152367 RepID=A0AAP0I8U3_9MAGN
MRRRKTKWPLDLVDGENAVQERVWQLAMAESLRLKNGVVPRGDGGTPITDQESSCVGVRRTCATFSHSNGGGYQLSSEESSRGFAPSRAGKRSAEEESGFRPSALRGGDGKYYARGGVQAKWSFTRETGEEGTVRSKDANMM